MQFQQTALEKTAHWATRNPSLIFALTWMAIVYAALQLPHLGVSTSRNNLFSPKDNPSQALFLETMSKFSDLGGSTLVVSGGSPATRRLVVDRLMTAIANDKKYIVPMLGRLGPTQLAPILLLQGSDWFANLSQDFVKAVNGGMPDVLKLMTQQIQFAGNSVMATAGLSMFSASTKASPALIKVESEMQHFAKIANAFNDYLQGQPLRQDLWSAPVHTASAVGIDPFGYLTGNADSNIHLLALFYKFKSDEISVTRPWVEHIRLIRDRVLKEFNQPDLKVQLTGVAALSVDEQATLERTIWQTSLATFLGISIFLWLTLRSVSQLFLALLPLGLGAILSLGLTQVLYGGLNLVTSGFLSVLLGLGIDFPIHYLQRVDEYRRNGLTQQQAAIAGLKTSGPGIITGALTTIIAFWVVSRTSFTAFSQLGVVTACGLVIILLFTLILLPLLRFYLPLTKVPLAPELKFMTHLHHWIIIRPKIWVSICLCTAFWGLWQLPNMKFNGRNFDLLPSYIESTMALNTLETLGTAGPMFAIVTTPSIASARQLSAQLKQLDTVKAVHSPSDLFPPLDKKLLKKLNKMVLDGPQPDFSQLLNVPLTTASILRLMPSLETSLDQIETALILATRPTDVIETMRGNLKHLEKTIKTLDTQGLQRLAALPQRVVNLFEPAWHVTTQAALKQVYHPSMVPEVLRRRFVSNDGKQLALYVYPKSNLSNTPAATKFREQLQAIAPHATGMAITMPYHSNMIMKDFSQSALIAAVFVFLLLWIDFRRFGDAVFTLIPVITGWAWLIGMMHLFDLSFNIVNVVVLPLLFGIGCDSGAHFMHRWRQTPADDQGRIDLSMVMRGTGGAITLASMTTLLGFGGLMISDYGASRSLGLVMVLGIAACWLASVVFLPALLTLTRYGQKSSSPTPNKLIEPEQFHQQFRN